MPLYIKDSAVATFARDYQSMTGARTMTEAVRTALQLAIDQARNEAVRDTIARHQTALRIGKKPRRCVRKKSADDLWGQ